MPENGAKTDGDERAPGKALRPFAIESRRKESDVITSFVLRPSSPRSCCARSTKSRPPHMSPAST